MQGTAGPIRLGVIGTGLAVEQLHWPALRRMPERFQIVAFANTSRAKAEHFAEYTGASMADYTPDYHDLLARSDVDAVLISLPIALNYPITRDAVAAGKHVICEKPTGKDEAEGRAFVALAETRPDCKLLIAENYFYRDDLRLARTLLDANAIGRVHMMAWRKASQSIPRAGTFSSTPWRHRPAYRGGAHLDGGVHDTAQMRLLCGDATTVYGAQQFANATIDAPSDLTLTLTFFSGAIGSYAATYPDIPVPPEPNEMRLYGTEGVMVIGPEKRQELAIYHPDGSIEEHFIEGSDLGYFGEFLNFYEAIVYDALIVGTVAQSFANMLIMLRGLDAAEQEKVMSLADVPGGLSATSVPLWKPYGAAGLFDGLPVRHSVRTKD